MFKQPSQPVAVGIRVNKALNGIPIPIVIGQHRVSADILWYNGFKFKNVSVGKFGKGGTFPLYTANVIAALCQGPVFGVTRVWTENGTFTSGSAAESVTIGTGGGGYTPINVDTFQADLGVYESSAISVTVNDYGSPGAQSIAQPINVPHQKGPTAPAAPTLSQVAGGSIGATTYYVKITYVYSTGATLESLASIEESLSVSASHLLQVLSPIAPPLEGTNAIGWNVYVSNVPGFEVKQNAATIPIGTNWTEPLGGLISGLGVPAPPLTYSLDTNNNYIFSPADAGKAVTLNYQYSLEFIYTAETFEVPVTVPYQVRVSQYLFIQANSWQVYYYPSGVQLTQVSGTPTSAGTFQYGGTGLFNFAPADAGQTILIKYQYKDSALIGAPAAEKTLNFSFFNGATGQSPWSFVAETDASLGYSQIAYVAAAPWTLGAAAQFPNYNYEILGFYTAGAGISDANPVDAVVGILTDPVWGLGFPVGALLTGDTIGNVVSGSWSNPRANNWFPNYFNVARAWCGANGLFVSQTLSSQRSAGSTIGDWLEACQLMGFFSEGKFKIYPLGDTSIAGNGYLYVPLTNPIVDLDDHAFLNKKQPVKLTCKPWEDSYNRVQVNYQNRLNSYAPDIVYEQDDGSVSQYGLRSEGPKQWDFLTNLSAATVAANLRLRRLVNIRNGYEFDLPPTFSYLEPLDLVTITDPNLGLFLTPVRILKIVDDQKKGLTITCEEFPWGTASATLYPKQVSDPFLPVYGQQDPGDTQAIIFDVPSRQTLNPSYDTIYCACNSETGNPNWGGSLVYISKDGEAFNLEGRTTGRANIGILSAALSSHVDPDVINTLQVTMNSNADALDAGSNAAADSFETRCAIITASGEVEIIAYGSAVANGPNQYSLTYLRRGILGTMPLSHAQGESFVVLDENVFEFQYDPTWYSGQINIVNPQFDQGFSFMSGLFGPTGWTVLGNGSPFTNPIFSFDSVLPFSGVQSLVIEAFDRYQGILQQFNCVGGQIYSLFAAMRFISGGMQPRLFLQFWSGEPGPTTFLGALYLNAKTTDTKWHTFAGSFVAPAGATFVQVGTDCEYITTSSITTWEVDDFIMTLDGTPLYFKFASFNLYGQKVQDPTNLNAATYVPQGELTLFEALTGNKVDTSSPGILPRGSTPVSFSGQFNFVPSSTSVKFTWTGNIIYLADGTTITIPDNTAGFVVSGLKPSTTYYFYPRWNDAKELLEWVGTFNLANTLTLTGVLLNGSSGSIETTSSLLSPSSYTIECWFFTQSSGSGVLVSFESNQDGASGTLGPYIEINNGLLSAGTKTGASTAATTLPYNDGNWHHVVASYSGTQMSLYVDGALVVGPTTLSLPSSFSGYWRIGQGDGIGFYSGTVGNVAIYSGGLNAAQILANYNAILTGTVSSWQMSVTANGAVYGWLLNEASGTSAADFVGSNTGTYSGSFTLGSSEFAIQAFGSPQVAWPFANVQAAQAQNLLGMFPLSGGGIPVTTTASGVGTGGTGGGSGAGGGRGGKGTF